ncbi:FAD-binding oxidoreductase [Blastococcus sp. CT_GayMR16]|uniref:FAD-dependent oxidoreductase n=1 Tax=Blastococcus sp. CT_GayMR16 TaxID=2559607 RepID=UPI001073E1D3|nr:FAD-binding oxidoreductase [Blastococcus sp. CT_GayMR16]TFV91081.1 FAD-binding oxidoreductase [Blastococcus sp. CT_GayMR16]
MTGTSTITTFARSMSSRSALVQPSDEEHWLRLLDHPGPRGVTVRGAGAGYSDAALNSGGTIATTHGNHRIRAWDDRAGVVDVDAGLSVADLCAFTVPRGWLLPVVPGTGRVTIGGALAADVHGKNHPRRGSLAQHVVGARLLTPGAGVLQIGPDRESDVFWATAGGLGLTGVVLATQLRLARISTSWLATEEHTCADLDDVLATMRACEPSHEYVVAWLDGLATGAATGRGVVSTAVHLTADELPASLIGRPLAFRSAGPSAPLPAGPRLIRTPVMRAANAARFAAARRARGVRLKGITAALHPLDATLDWTAAYGRRGLIQYQFSVPDGQEQVLEAALVALSAARCWPTLAVLKRLGDAAPGPLSFPSPGWTLALDLPTAAATAAASVLDRLDDLVLAAGGRVYLVKDSRLRSCMVPAMYPRLDEWRRLRNALDPSGVLTSDLDRRLDLSGRHGGDRQC